MSASWTTNHCRKLVVLYAQVFSQASTQLLPSTDSFSINNPPIDSHGNCLLIFMIWPLSLMRSKRFFFLLFLDTINNRGTWAVSMPMCSVLVLTGSEPSLQMSSFPRGCACFSILVTSGVVMPQCDCTISLGSQRIAACSCLPVYMLLSLHSWQGSEMHATLCLSQHLTMLMSVQPAVQYSSSGILPFIRIFVVCRLPSNRLCQLPGNLCSCPSSCSISCRSVIRHCFRYQWSVS